MEDTYLSFGPSSFPLDQYYPTQRQQRSSLVRQSFLLGEPVDYGNFSAHLFEPGPCAAGEEPIAGSTRIPADEFQNSRLALDMKLPADLLQSTDGQDTWRYAEPSAGGQQIADSGVRSSSNRYFNQAFASVGYDEPRGTISDYPDVDALGRNIPSCSTTPNIKDSPSTESWPLLLDEPGSVCHQEDGMLGLTYPNDVYGDGEEGSRDKPYARLIHEALMQAPGHRLMLREIYDWFVQNTNKPTESGTNGWQNSIRHNLSMNLVSLVVWIEARRNFQYTDTSSRPLRTIDQTRRTRAIKREKLIVSGFSRMTPSNTESNQPHATGRMAVTRRIIDLGLPLHSDNGPEQKEDAQPDEQQSCGETSNSVKAAILFFSITTTTI
jgi:hypothetical protein